MEILETALIICCLFNNLSKDFVLHVPLLISGIGKNESYYFMMCFNRVQFAHIYQNIFKNLDCELRNKRIPYFLRQWCSNWNLNISQAESKKSLFLNNN